MQRCICLWSVLFLTISLPAPADTPAKKSEAKPITVPIEVLKSKHLAILVKINGKGPYRMIFDTGAPLNLVGNKVAKESGMIAKDAKNPPIALFGALGQHPIQTLEIGEAKLEKVPSMVMDHPAVAALSQMLGPLEGIVGFPVFGRFTMTIDYQAQKMTLVPNGYEPADILETLTKTLMSGKNQPPTILAPAAQWGLVVTKDDKDEEPGVTIDQVRPGSAAAKAGLKSGDRLLSIDSRWTETVLDCYRAAGSAKPDRDVPVVIRRDGKDLRVNVRPRPGL